jgi:hypothetical protein
MIPNIVHFNYGLVEQKEEFLFVYYIAILSCKVINYQDKIFFHYHFEPFGKWWDKTKVLVDLIRVKIPTHLGEKELKKVAHKSDVLRINVLKEYGGIYLDIDTICVKPYARLLSNNMVMGVEITDSRKFLGLCNAIMFSKPNSSFITEWVSQYEQHFNPDGWQESSTILPFEISKTNKDITVLQRNVFFYPCWDRIDLIFEKESEIPDELITLHFWNHYAMDYIKNISGFDWVLDNSHTLYGKLLIHVFGLISIIEQKKILENTTYDFLTSQIKAEHYNLINKVSLETDEAATKHYLENKDCNLIFSALFINLINVCKKVAYKVFELDVDIDVVSSNIAITSLTTLDCKGYFIEINTGEPTELSEALSQSNTTIQLNKTSFIYNINESFYVFPPELKITTPVCNKTIKYFISIPDAKFIITTHVISEREALLVIRRSDCDWGWNENLYLDLIDNETNNNEYFYIGKSCENTMKVVVVIGDDAQQLKSVNLDYAQKIPKKIFQTWKCPVSDMNKEMLNTVLSIQEMNPEYEYKLFDDSE